MKQLLTARIKSKAIEFGFSKVRVAQAKILTKENSQLHAWLANGFQASMRWMTRDLEERIDPSKILQNVKSVLSVALNYYTPTRHSTDPAIGKISRYAWGDDYHIVMTERLMKLLDYIKSENTGVTGKIYVDTGPVMDKVWAVHSGNGWMGKHTNLITPEFGSWVFLGEILLDIELEYDLPITDRCGTCTACIEACPTHAIVEPYVIDSNKCLSYLTIENRGELEKKLTLRSQNWVYGCDICQDVCPWNRFQKESLEKSFQAREYNITPKLTELAEMTQDEFNRRYSRSPIKRTKLYGLIRNARSVVESQSRSV